MEGQYRRNPFIAKLLVAVLLISLLIDSSAVQMVAETVLGAETVSGSDGNTVSSSDATTNKEGGESFLERLNFPSLFALPNANGVDTVAELVTALEAGGNVQLDGNIDLVSTEENPIEFPIDISADTALDLNGYTITVGDVAADYVFEISNGAEFVLTDESDGETVSVECEIIEEDAPMSVDADGNITYTTTKVTTTTAKGSITGSNKTLFNVADGKFTMAGGVLEDNTPVDYYPVIIIVAGSTFEMTGGIIRENLVNAGDNNTSVIYAEGEGDLSEGAAVTVSLSGGAISNNATRALRTNDAIVAIFGNAMISGNEYSSGTVGGGAIRLGVTDNKSSKLTMTGGYICDNYSKTNGGGISVGGSTIEVEISGGYICKNKTDRYGGGIYIGSATAVVKEGAVISGNEAAIKGGGVAIYNYGALQMEGGTIAGNAAISSEGGGIAIDGDCSAVITGGNIICNSTKTHRDWGGGGVFCAENATLDITNVLITDNNVGGFGGGVAVCPTGITYLFANQGGAIFGNSAEGENTETGSTKREDEEHKANAIFMSNGYEDYYSAKISAVYDAILGGGSAQWKGSADGEYVESSRLNPILVSEQVMGLTAYTSNEDRENAAAQAKVVISGNYSYTHGGGILCNGVMRIGEMNDDGTSGTVDAALKVSANKTVAIRGENAGTLQEIPQFTFQLKDANGNVIETATNDKAGNIVFEKFLIGGNDAVPANCPTCVAAGTTNAVQCAHNNWNVTYTLEEAADSVQDDIQNDKTSYKLDVQFEIIRTDRLITVDTTPQPISTWIYKINNVTVTAVNSQHIGVTSAFGLADAENNTGAYVTIGDAANAAFVNEISSISVSGEKIWDDENDYANKRPDSITVILYADGDEADRQVITPDTNGDWKYSFTNLPKRNADNKEITYTVREESVPSGYDDPIYRQTENGYDITNTNTLAKTSISGEKIWVDAGAENRPNSITVVLKADDKEIDRQVVSEATDWKYSFTDLYVYSYSEDGTESKITYTVEEAVVPDGYEATYVPDSYDIINTSADMVTISGEKIWEDEGNRDGKRPGSITVVLYADGDAKRRQVITPDTNGDWKYHFEGLPKYDTDGEITYTVKEETVPDNYSVSYKTDENDPHVINITNTYNVEETQFSVQKIWVDADNKYGLRPDSITVILYADGDEVKRQEITPDSAGDWKYTFTNLPKNRYDETMKQSVPIKYSVSEEPVTGYNGPVFPVEDGVITNQLQTTTVKVVKNWDDMNDWDEIRPDSIEVILYADKVEIERQTLTADANGKWENTTYTFTDLPVYNKSGEAVEYSIVETAVEGYNAPVITQSKTPTNIVFDITNTHEVLTTSISGKKIWNDEDDWDGLRPDSVEIILLADDVEKDRRTVTAENDWKYVFDDLPVKKAGKEISYTIQEETVRDYDKPVITGTENGYDITNTHEVEKTFINVQKVWEDDNNWDGLRPAKIEVYLKADGVKQGDAVELSDVNDWKYTFDNLPVYKKGTKETDKIQYSIEEVEVSAYNTATTQNGNDVTITNSRNVVKIDVTVEKLWEDADNAARQRPREISVILKADGEQVGEVVKLSEANNWKYVFEDLHKYQQGGMSRPGKEIHYTVEEVVDEETQNRYATKVVENQTTGGITFTVTNTAVTSIDVTKVWNDNNNSDNSRPKNISVKLYADEVYQKTAIIQEDLTGNWKYTFANLPKYNGEKEIAYRVEETDVPGYKTEAPVQTGDGRYSITNTLVTEVCVTKNWDDMDNKDGLRPESIAVELYGDGALKENATIKADADGNWSYTFKDLPKYAGGNEIKYIVMEKAVDGYLSGNPVEVTPGNFSITNTQITSVSVMKIWNDNNDQDGLRPDEITVKLLANGNLEQTATIKKESADTNGNWKYTFTDLPKYINGEEITYTVMEDAVSDYALESMEQSSNGNFVITNKHTSGETVVNVTKEWDDGNNRDGKRPESITVNLYANGTFLKSAEIRADEFGNWYHSFTGLATHADGKKITYSVEETPVTGYETEPVQPMGDNAFLITNKYEPETEDITITKTWLDNNNQDGKRPENITVRLYANGKEISVVTVEPDNHGNWSYTFENQPKNENGMAMVYTVTEDAVKDYTSNSTDKTGTTNKLSAYNFNIVNEHEPEKLDFSVTKTWNDSKNQDGKRPESITVRLYANGIEKETVTLKEGADGKWTHSFTGLPKYENGKVIDYQLKEDQLADYHIGIAKDTAGNFTVINTTPIEMVPISGQKIWKDENNRDGKRPETITVVLLTDGEVLDENRDKITVTADANGDWKYDFGNRPKYKQGKVAVEIAYAVAEEGVTDDYLSDVQGFNITNTRDIELIDVTVIKKWDDDGDRDGKRPKSIDVVLEADGEAQKTVTLTEEHLTDANTWRYTFEGLPKYKEGEIGQKIVYTVKEQMPEELKDFYVASQSVSENSKGTVVTITNKHVSETIDVTVQKHWEDENNRDGSRPTDITVNLWSGDGWDDELSCVLTAENNWKYTFEDLPKNKAGVEIYYNAEEVMDKTNEHYVSEVDESGLTITNTRVINIDVKKVWDDEDDKDKVRPDSVTIELLKKDTSTGQTVSIGQKVTLSKEDNWAATFKNLPKYENDGKGTLVQYEVVEAQVKDYEKPSYAVTTMLDGAGDKVITGFVVTNVHKPEEPEDDSDEDEPEPPAPTPVPQPELSSVQTGDSNYLIVGIVIFVMAVSLLIASFFVGKKKNRE